MFGPNNFNPYFLHLLAHVSNVECELLFKLGCLLVNYVRLKVGRGFGFSFTMNGSSRVDAIINGDALFWKLKIRRFSYA